ncbi:apicoplast pyruvate carrier 1-like isoform X1 [Tachypleus tridentatus]|uniref:apicoplast pyruvate carrier 1-like isoform X1 n=2 Tax=Tachypleus tridentatus TaxID=6853 RepID=UPI003FD39EAC
MKARPCVAVLGCFLMYVGLGVPYLFGNITPYLTSYLRQRVNNNTTYEETSWIIYTTESIVSFTFIGVWVAERIGQKATIVIGNVIFSCGIAGTYWAIQYSLEATIVIFGVIANLGYLCFYGFLVPVAMEWFPNNKALVAGIVSSGAAFTPVLMNNLHTFFMNPNNLEPDDDGYFYNSEILDRVPTFFLILGAVQGGIIFIGLLLYQEPRSETPKVEHISDRPMRVAQIKGNTSSASIRKGSDPGDKACLSTFQEESSVVSEDISTSPKADETQPSLAKVTFVTPKEALKMKEFYLLIIIFTSSLHSTMFLNSFYKTYGQTFIDDDTFLATSGSTSAVVHSLLRVIVGRIQDKISYKLTCLILMGLKTILLFTLVATPYGGKVMFIIWICGLFATFSVEFVCIPATISEVFGKKHTAMIYGMAYFVAGGTLLFWPLMLKLIIPHFGWFATFSLMGSMTFIGFLVVMVFPERYLTQPAKTTVSNEEEITFDEAVLGQK